MKMTCFHGLRNMSIWTSLCTELGNALTMLAWKWRMSAWWASRTPRRDHRTFTFHGLEWERERIRGRPDRRGHAAPQRRPAGAVPPDRRQKEMIVLTGAPNLYEYKGTGPLPKPLKVAYAREGARLYDGHKPGQELTTLKRTPSAGWNLSPWSALKRNWASRRNTRASCCWTATRPKGCRWRITWATPSSYLAFCPI